jgi:hypothetical protein
MTKEELIGIIDKYPPNMNVQVALYRFISDIVKVDKVIDQDTNAVSICLFGKTNN